MRCSRPPRIPAAAGTLPEKALPEKARPGNGSRPGSSGAGEQTPEDGTDIGARSASGVRWSLLAVLSKQGFQMLSAVVLARLLGPESYGIVSVASLFIVFTTLLLDQGLSSALIQRPRLTPRAAGATFTLNLVLAAIVGAATWVCAPAIAGFFRVDGLAELLRLIALALPLKALGITPRALLARKLRFRGIAAADIAAAVLGSAAGIAAALLGAGYFAVLYQTVLTDLVTAAVLLACTRGPAPNLHLGEVRPLLGFSAGVFATNGLAYFSRNIDNILVGRVLGVASLSLYAMAYRVLVVPVQLIGQTVNRVMFPAFARAAADPAQVAAQLRAAMALLAACVIPLMAFVACAAPSLVHLVLGGSWLAAAPLMSILAIGGARETVFYIAPSLMKGLGRAGLNLRYELLATAAQLSGIIIGLQFGLFGVAAGYTAAGFALTPVLMFLQSRLTGVGMLAQMRILWPPVHASLWGSAAYLLLGRVLPNPGTELFLGLALFLFISGAVLALFHRPTVRTLVPLLQRVLRRRVPVPTRGA